MEKNTSSASPAETPWRSFLRAFPASQSNSVIFDKSIKVVYYRNIPETQGEFAAKHTLGRRSMLDLLHTLQDLQAWNVSLIAQTGLQLDLRSAQGKLIASLMAALAEFERDLLRERVRSGIAAARKRGVRFGRQHGSTPDRRPTRG